MTQRKLTRLISTVVLYCAPLIAGAGEAEPDYSRQRAQLIKTIQADAAGTSIYLDKEKLDPRVLKAMGRVKRHALVPEDIRSLAYANRPLPIGHGQTISQPYVVALMTDLLKPRRLDKVLEVGTGSGYQAAVLAELVSKVFTMEIIEPLGERASRDLKTLGYDNIEVEIGDGYYGWPEEAPFDAIIVTAAASHIPPPLLKQLKPGGRMVIPVGTRFMVQQLVLVEKSIAGKITTRQVLPVRFVPLTGGPS